MRMADAASRDLEPELESANADLERVVMEAPRARKILPRRERKEELEAEIWRRRIRAIELERDYVSEQLMKARHATDRAATGQDYDEYLRANQGLIRLRIRFLNAADLLEKLRADGPDSSARLLGGG
jgi:hypothetical protein